MGVRNLEMVIQIAGSAQTGRSSFEGWICGQRFCRLTDLTDGIHAALPAAFHLVGYIRPLKAFLLYPQQERSFVFVDSPSPALLAARYSRDLILLPSTSISSFLR